MKLTLSVGALPFSQNLWKKCISIINNKQQTIFSLITSEQSFLESFKNYFL